MNETMRRILYRLWLWFRRRSPCEDCLRAAGVTWQCTAVFSGGGTERWLCAACSSLYHWSDDGMTVTKERTAGG